MTKYGLPFHPEFLRPPPDIDCPGDDVITQHVEGSYLRCLAYFPLTWPPPSQPGVGQLGRKHEEEVSDGKEPQ